MAIAKSLVVDDYDLFSGGGAAVMGGKFGAVSLDLVVVVVVLCWCVGNVYSVVVVVVVVAAAAVWLGLVKRER